MTFSWSLGIGRAVVLIDCAEGVLGCIVDVGRGCTGAGEAGRGGAGAGAGEAGRGGAGAGAGEGAEGLQVAGK